MSKGKEKLISFKTSSSRSNRLLLTKWALLFWRTWPAAVDPIWTLLVLDERDFNLIGIYEDQVRNSFNEDLGSIIGLR